MDMAWAVSALEQYGLLGVFIVLSLEYACFPMPSEVLLPASGLILAAARIPLALGVAISVAAGLTGSAFCYAIGAYGGRPLIGRLLKRFPRAQKGLVRTETWQKKTGGLSVMIARVIPIFRTWISFVSGFTRQPFRTFILYSAIGIIIWNTLLMGSGYYLFTSGIGAKAVERLWLLPVIVGGGVFVAVLYRVVRKKVGGQ